VTDELIESPGCLTGLVTADGNLLDGFEKKWFRVTAG